MSDPNYDEPAWADFRMRYFDTQMLGSQDFVDESMFHFATLHRRDRLLTSSGIAEGLDVTVTGGASSLTVASGTAFDPRGRQILLVQAARVDTSKSAPGAYALTIQFNEVEDDDVKPIEGGEGYIHWKQQPIFALTPLTAQPPADSVLLTNVALASGGGITLDASVRMFSGARLPAPNAQQILLRATADEGWAELTGSLRAPVSTLSARSLVATGSIILNSSPSAAAALDVAGRARLGAGSNESWFPDVNGDASISGNNIRLRGPASQGSADLLYVNGANGRVSVGSTQNINSLFQVVAPASGMTDYGMSTFQDGTRNGLSFGYDTGNNYAWIYARSVGVQWRTLNINNAAYFDSGKVGIGIDSRPRYTLSVRAGTDRNLHVRANSDWDPTLTGVGLQATNDANSASVGLRLDGSPIQLMSGNVGINNVKPNYTLDVVGAASFTGPVGIGATPPVNSILALGGDLTFGTSGRAIYWTWPQRRIDEVAPTTTSMYIRFMNSGTYSDSSNPLGGFAFTNQDGTSIMRILQGGIGLGSVSAPQSLLNLPYAATGGVNTLLIGNKNDLEGSNYELAIAVPTNNGGHWPFGIWKKGSGYLFAIDVNGGQHTGSDLRLKESVAVIEDALDGVLGLRGVRFNWKDSGAESMGLIAQDVEPRFPEAVHTDSEGRKSLDYHMLIAVLVEAIKQLKQDHDQLERKIDGR
ncbi:MAG TPA: tail fiber domain-containing protein [Polyangia bacterium]|nr:tail fiber domain-containing protein [Polyangia bacterium]